jgi:hypothetical protein
MVSIKGLPLRAMEPITRLGESRVFTTDPFPSFPNLPGKEADQGLLNPQDQFFY